MQADTKIFIAIVVSAVIFTFIREVWENGTKKK